MHPRPNHPKRVTGVILAGGKSSRFGQDKGLYPYQGQALVIHALETFKPLCNEIFISTNKPEEYAFTGFEAITDLVKDCGPLGGIFSGLHHASHNKILFLGCDMPLVPGELMNLLLKKLDDHDAAVPQHHGFRETLCIAMNRSALPVVQKAIEGKRFRILNVLQDLNTCFPEVSQLPFYSPPIFTNINYPKDIENLSFGK
ncbi:MAG: molybdenum cofactor guanylyltransferase [Bacteroidales bacterium]